MTSDGLERLGLPPLVELPVAGSPFLPALLSPLRSCAPLSVRTRIFFAPRPSAISASRIFRKNIGELRCYGISVGDPISFETSIILQLCKLFRYRHFHDKGPAFPFADEPYDKNNISSCIMEVVKFDGFAGYSRTNESFVSME